MAGKGSTRLTSVGAAAPICLVTADMAEISSPPRLGVFSFDLPKEVLKHERKTQFESKLEYIMDPLKRSQIENIKWPDDMTEEINIHKVSTYYIRHFEMTRCSFVEPYVP